MKLLPLLFRRVEVSSASLDGAWISMYQSTPEPEAAPGDTTRATRFRIQVPRVDFHDLNVRTVDPLGSGMDFRRLSGHVMIDGSFDAPSSIQISAKDLKFSTTQLNAPAGKTFSVVFDNQEGAPHNVAIYKDQSASEKVFVQEPFSGPKVVTYQVGPLAAGSYFFRCDVHTDMKGTLTVK